MKGKIAIVLTLAIILGSAPNICWAEGENNTFADTELQLAGEGQRVISQSPISMVSREENFEDAQVSEPGASVGNQYDEENYYKAEAKPSGSTVCVAEDDNNKFLRLHKEANSGYASYSFEYAVTPSTKAELSYRIRFNKPYSANYMALPVSGTGGAISTTYIAAQKFGLNFSGNAEAVEVWGATKEISGPITLGKWYTLHYKMDSVTKTYSLKITDEDGKVITDLTSVPFRNDAEDFSNLKLTNPSDTVGASEIDIDDVYSASWSQDTVYYSITAPQEIVNGDNEIGVQFANLTGEKRDIGVYLRIYEDGKFLKYEKLSFPVENGESDSQIVNINTSAYYQEGVTYTCDALVIGDNGANYAAASQTTLSGADSIRPKVTADYGAKGLRVNGTTEYDNSTVMVLAPGCSLEEALAEPNGKLVCVESITDTNMNLLMPVADEYGEGQYTVVITSVNNSGEVAKKSVSQYYCGNAIAEQMLTDFNAAQEETVSSVAERYMTEHPVLTSLDESIKDFYANNQSVLNAAILEGKPYTSVDDIVKIFNNAFSISKLVQAETVEEFVKLFESYADSFGLDLTEENYQKHKKQVDSRLYQKLHNHFDITVGMLVKEFNDIVDEVSNVQTEVIAQSPVSIASQKENFEDMEVSEPGARVGQQYDQENYYKAEANPSGTTVWIAEEDNNRFLRFHKEANSGYASYSFEYAVTPSTKAELSYRIRFNKPYSANYMALPVSGTGGAISTTYINSQKFGLNFSGNTEAMEVWGATKEISGPITLGRWYTLLYKMDSVTQTYSLKITDENGKVITDLSSVPFRNNVKDFSNLKITSPSDTSGASDIDIDDVYSDSWSQDTVYYSITAPKKIANGDNEIGVQFTNLTGEKRDIGVYLRIYADGKFLKYEKLSFPVENGKSDSQTVHIDTSAYYQEGVTYTCDALVIGDNGANYAAASQTTLTGSDSIQPNVTADYGAKGLRMSGTTEYDNSTVIVLAPGCSLEEALAEPNGKLVYVASVTDNNFNVSLPVADEYGEGQYTVVITSVNNSGEVAKKSISQYYCGNAVAEQMLRDFNNAQAETVSAVTKKYMEEHPVFDENIRKFYESNQSAMNTALLKGKPYTSVNDIVKIFEDAFKISNLMQAETAEEFAKLFEEYAVSFGLDLTAEDYKKYKQQVDSRLYQKLHNQAGITVDYIAGQFRNAVMIAEFNGADRLTIESILIKYASVTGIDVSTNVYKNNKAAVNKAMTAENVVFNEPEDVLNTYNTIIRNLSDSGKGSGITGGGSSGSGCTTKVNPSGSVGSNNIATENNPSPAEQTFGDIDGVPWAKESILRLKTAGVIDGVDKENFDPNGYVTREAFAKMITIAFKVSGEAKSFRDVDASQWYAPYVSALGGAGIIGGVGEDLFGVGQNLTRQDAAVILDRVAEYMGYDFEYDVSALHIFTDTIADYAVGSVQKLYQLIIMDLQGKKVLFLGDSITEGIGVSSPEKCYVSVFGKMSGAEVKNYGVSGTRIARQKAITECRDWDRDFMSRVDEMDETADVIVVFGGTNDFGHGDAKIGSFDSRDEYTFYGAMHILCTKLIHKYPEAEIVFMTPLHRLGEEDRVNSIGRINEVPLSGYADIIKEVAGYYGLRVLDLFHTSGIQPNVEIIQEKYMPDGVHPSDAGAEKIAGRLYEFLR